MFTDGRQRRPIRDRLVEFRDELVMGFIES